MIALDPRQDVGHQIGIHQADHARTNICDLNEVVVSATSGFRACWTPCVSRTRQSGLLHQGIPELLMITVFKTLHRLKPL